MATNITQPTEDAPLEPLSVEALKPEELSRDDALAWGYSLWQDIVAYIDKAESYYQLLIVLGTIGIAYLVSYILRNPLNLLKEPKPGVAEGSTEWLLRRSGRLFAPVIIISLLGVAIIVGGEYFNDITILKTANRVAAIWLTWVALKAYVTNHFVRTLALWLLIPAAMLQLVGVFDATVGYLDSLGFSISDYKITIFTVARGLLVISGLMWVASVLTQNLEYYIRSRRTLNVSTKELLTKIATIAAYIILTIIMLQMIGINLTALTVFGGAIGVGLGFGLQKIASNFISGIIMLTERNITIGNLVQLDNGTTGFVRSMGARASVMEAFDGSELIVPNEDFIVSRVSNLTHSNTYGRVDFDIGVAYASDIHKVKQVIQEVLDSLEIAIKDPEPQVYLREFGDSSINFKALFWIEDVTEGRWAAQDTAMFAVWDALKENGIEIPFPQRDLHLRSSDVALLTPPTPKAEDKS